MTSQDQIKDLRGRVDALEKYLDIPGKRAEIAEKETCQTEVNEI